MAKKFFKSLYKVIEFLLGFIIILLILLTIRLAHGPIEIKTLTPMVIQALAPEDSGMEVGLKNAYIELALKRGRLMDIRLTELSVMDNEGFVLSVEKANVSFNPFWLLLGKVVIRDVYLEKPYIQVDFTQPKTAVMAAENKRPLGRKLNRARRYIEKLEALNVANGEIVLKVNDEGSILLPNLGFSMERELGDKMVLTAAGEFYFDGTFMEWGIDGLYRLDEKILKFESFVKDVDLSKMQNVVPDLKGVDLVLDGSVKGTLDLSRLREGWQKVFDTVTFSATTQKPGSLYLPPPLDTTYDIESAVIKGTVRPELTGVDLKDSFVKTLGQTAAIEASVSDLNPFFQTKDFSKVNGQIIASITDIPLTKVPELWPESEGTEAHNWIRDNITAGTISKASLIMDMKGSAIDNLTAVLDVQDAVVRYMDEMPVATKGKGRVTLGMDYAKIQVQGGEVNGVKATGGFVNFLELDKDIPRFDLKIGFKGDINKGLAIVSTPPLNVCQDLTISCPRVDGSATGIVQINFFFDNNPNVPIKFAVTADLEDAGVPVPKTDWLMSDGTFKMNVNNEKFTLNGRAMLDEKPIQLDVTELFGEEAEHNSLYQVKTPITASMLAPYFEHIDDFLKGTLMADITIRPLKNDESTVGLEFGLKDAEITLPIGYVKELQKEGTLKATLEIKKDKLTSIPSIYLSLPDEGLLIKGRATMPKGKVFDLELTEVQAPKTEAKISLSYFENGMFDVDVKGKKINIENLIHGDFFGREQPASQVNTIQEEHPQDFKITASVDMLYMSQEQPFTNVKLNVQKENGKWLALDGHLMGKVPFTFALNEQKTALTVQTEDVGTFLKRAGYTNRIQGGQLNSTLMQKNDGSLTGQIKIKNFQLTKTPFFVQAATLLGIVDAIRGDTLQFDKAIIPFTLSPTHVVTIEDAVASGTAVGITGRGRMSSENVDITGSVAPAYALNSLPGKIPVVGTLLSGGEKGGGLFGVSYSVTGKVGDTKFSFNPVSLLTPGIFRRLFDVF